MLYYYICQNEVEGTNLKILSIMFDIHADVNIALYSVFPIKYFISHSLQFILLHLWCDCPGYTYTFFKTFKLAGSRVFITFAFWPSDPGSNLTILALSRRKLCEAIWEHGSPLKNVCKSYYRLTESLCVKLVSWNCLAMIVLTQIHKSSLARAWEYWHCSNCFSL